MDEPSGTHGLFMLNSKQSHGPTGAITLVNSDLSATHLIFYWDLLKDFATEHHMNTSTSFHSYIGIY